MDTSDALAIVRKLAEMEPTYHASNSDDYSYFTCPFCTPSGYRHEPTCLVMDARKFVDWIEGKTA